MNSIHSLTVASCIAAVALSAHAQVEPRRLGDHPAVVVQRLHKNAGYDYASKFYPHPAWLYLRPGPSDDAAAMAQTAPAEKPAQRAAPSTADSDISLNRQAAR